MFSEIPYETIIAVVPFYPDLHAFGVERQRADVCRKFGVNALFVIARGNAVRRIKPVGVNDSARFAVINHGDVVVIRIRRNLHGKFLSALFVGENQRVFFKVFIAPERGYFYFGLKNIRLNVSEFGCRPVVVCEQPQPFTRSVRIARNGFYYPAVFENIRGVSFFRAIADDGKSQRNV